MPFVLSASLKRGRFVFAFHFQDNPDLLHRMAGSQGMVDGAEQVLEAADSWSGDGI